MLDSERSVHADTWRGRRARVFRAGGNVAVLALIAACAGDGPRADGTTPPALDTLPGAAAAAPTPDTVSATDVTVFFTRDEQRTPVTRKVPATVAVLSAALEALLAGPTDAERARGIDSWFSAETAGMLIAASIDEDGRATVDFADFSTIIPNASASAGSEMLLGELDATVFQFEAVHSVEYRLEGDCARFFEWLQRSCERIEREG